ncbi:MAG: CoA-binding protein [Elusimicrobia bacterium]|nr:CoA-binding protein [Elusimicrobiota bacterium]
MSGDSCRVDDPRDAGTDRNIDWILGKARNVAVVGLSPKTSRPSYQVSEVLKREGYRVIPVRPGVKEVLGEKAYGDLEEIGETIDLVLIFRRSEFVLPIVEKAVKKRAAAVWMQEGIVNEEAARLAVNNDMKVVMDRCISKEIFRRKQR